MYKKNMIVMVVVMLIGCSGEKAGISTQSVSGRVLYGNKPAEGVAIYLGPIAAPTIPDIPANPHGVTDKDGRFSISTYGENDGAPKGKYQLMMMWVDENSKLESKPERFFGWYDSVNSKIMVQINEGDNLIPDIKVPVITGRPEPVNGIVGRN